MLWQALKGKIVYVTTPDEIKITPEMMRGEADPSISNLPPKQAQRRIAASQRNVVTGGLERQAKEEQGHVRAGRA